MRKLLKGTRLIAVPNGKNAKDWTIRHREPNNDMIVYTSYDVFSTPKWRSGSGSTTAKVWV